MANTAPNSPPPGTTRLDSLAAWRTASSLVSANRDMLLAIAGVFFMLPSLAFAVIVPEPEMPAGADNAAMMRLVSDYYYAALPYLLAVTVLQMAGMITLQIVMTDRARPTVAQAIRRGFAATLPYLLAQLLFGLALGVGIGVAMTLATLSGIAALGLVIAVVAMVVAAHLFLRFLLIAPVLANEPSRNPVAILRRSWELTRGQSGRMLGFFGMALLLFLVISSLILMFVGMLLAIVAEGEVERVLAAAVSSALTAVALVYFAGMMAAVYRQFAGPPPSEASAVFE